MLVATNTKRKRKVSIKAKRSVDVVPSTKGNPPGVTNHRSGFGKGEAATKRKAEEGILVPAAPAQAALAAPVATPVVQAAPSAAQTAQTLQTAASI